MRHTLRPTGIRDPSNENASRSTWLGESKVRNTSRSLGNSSRRSRRALRTSCNALRTSGNLSETTVQLVRRAPALARALLLIRASQIAIAIEVRHAGTEARPDHTYERSWR